MAFRARAARRGWATACNVSQCCMQEQHQAPHTLDGARVLNVGIGVGLLLAALVGRLPPHEPAPGLPGHGGGLLGDSLVDVGAEVRGGAVFFHCGGGEGAQRGEVGCNGNVRRADPGLLQPTTHHHQHQRDQHIAYQHIADDHVEEESLCMCSVKLNMSTNYPCSPHPPPSPPSPPPYPIPCAPQPTSAAPHPPH